MAKQGKNDDANARQATIGKLLGDAMVAIEPIHVDAEILGLRIDWVLSARYMISRRPAGPLSQDTPNVGGFFFAPGVAS